MSFISDTLSGASQLAAMLASRAKPGFSADPGDYTPTRIKLSGAEFDDNSKFYRPDLNPATDFLIGGRVAAAEGEPVIVLGTLSGHEERDRVVVDGKQTTKRHAIWKTQPEITVVKGKGGGLRTDRGGWITGRFDEIFFLVGRELCVLALYDQHYIVGRLNKEASALGVDALYEAKWLLTKTTVSDGQGYSHYEPRFELLGLAGEPIGPTEVELELAKKHTSLIGRLSHPLPNVPLRLVVNGAPFDEPPAADPHDPGPTEESAGPPIDDLSDWLKR